MEDLLYSFIPLILLAGVMSLGFKITGDNFGFWKPFVGFMGFLGALFLFTLAIMKVMGAL